MNCERAQMIVGLGGLATVVIGPLSMVLPMFFYTPLDARSWWQSLGVGLLIALLPLGGTLWLGRRGWLDPAQMAFGGVLLVAGTATLASGVGLVLNGLLDPATPAAHVVQVTGFTRDCATHKAQNSTTTIITCRNHGSFRFPGDAAPPIARAELPDDAVLAEGDTATVTIRSGAFGWRWGLALSAATDASPSGSSPG
ncbi:MAG: hypothetical protein AAF772_02445 [Acidobacteriota bacterium]